MKSYDPLKTRLRVLLGFFAAVLLAYSAVLYYTQIVHGSEYRAKSITSNATTETVEASRGIITDRNGKVLVSNRLTYTLTLDDAVFSDDDGQENAAIWRLIQLCQRNRVAWRDTLPLSKTVPVSYANRTDDNFKLFLDHYEINYHTSSTVLPDTDAGAFFTLLRQMYHIDSTYTDAQARLIAGVRYELSVCHLLDSKYVFASDVTVELISQVVDGHYEGVETGTASARVYNTTYAAHILGRLSPIYKEDWEGDEKNGIVGYRDKGYLMNTLVGRDGVEEAFEDYLHGTDGTRLITTNTEGKITGELYTKEPQPGNTVALTLDIDLQADTENTLAKTVQQMTATDGVTRGAAAVVMGVGNGEVLAMASYPTYDLSKWDEIYDDLVNDEAGTPLYNRATQGTYPPGSTFKPCTAVAALESGTITPNTTVIDRGIYDYYSSPQPRCWIYSSTGGTHGSVNVSQALTVSCNYFFYEVGRLTGIKTLSSYARQFGLGEYTGIEIGGEDGAESKGAVASPEYAEANGLEWTDGQTLTASIGQSYNLFTPLQLANYIATLVGNGEHYAAHLLKTVKSCDNTTLVYAYDEKPLNVVKMKDSTVEAIKSGMHNLTTSSLAGNFSQCVVSAGAKTGTAETSYTQTQNGVFVAFAPYDDPQIAVAISIEKAGSGAALANTAVDIINSYFSHDEVGIAIVGEHTVLK